MMPVDMRVKSPRILLAAIIAIGAFAHPAAAQNTSGGCAQAAAQEPATKPATASNDGTSPGNAGSTGWSGGTGGSNIGTAPAGTTAGAAPQPTTAKGLDLMGGAKAC